MATYAFITGDEYTKSEPIAFIYDNGKYEIICSSLERQKSFYDYLKKYKDYSFEQFLSTFSYASIESGEVTPEVESLLNTLRSKFMLQQVAQQEINAQEQDGKNPNRPVETALMKISKRMRNSENER